MFVLAVGVRSASAAGAFWGLIGGVSTVVLVALNTTISYLWLNVVGAVAVFVIGMVISRFRPLAA